VWEIYIIIDGTNHICKVSLKYRQQFDPEKLKTSFICIALAAILCSGAERAGDMHNKGWY
jgi:hypothetical protein